MLKTKTETREMIDSLNAVLKSFKVKASCVDAKRHRHFGFFDIKLAPGCKIADITKLSQEISLALQTKTFVSPKPIPELGIVRLQAVMEDSETLHFDDLYKKNPRGKGVLPLLMGETEEGNPLYMEMNKNPHLLIAGCTGSGKSTVLHLMIANAAKIKNCELYLVDTKLVEFNVYNNPSFKPIRFIAKTYSQTIKCLKHLISKMDKRYYALSKMGLKSIEEKPNLFRKTLLIVDEVSDLMIQDDNGQLEDLIVTLAQKARAAGIYIVLATQRPSVDVLTGLIKANFPGRLSCQVASKRDSLIILDESGAESLAGCGDAILSCPALPSVRFQAAFVNPKDTVKNYKEL